MIDYGIYVLPLKLKIYYVTIAAVSVFLIAYLFYRSVLLACILCPLGLLYPRYKRKYLTEKRRNELNLQFKDLLLSLSSSLTAGKSLEKSFEIALGDLYMLYPSEDAYIIRETKIIINRLSLNITVEEAIADFAKRSGIDDINNFSDVILICKRTGGNLIEAIKNSSGIISDKIEMKQEIETLLASRKFEQKILNVMPIAMIFILSTTAADYITPVFTTIQGRVAMTLCILLLLAAYLISNKIVNIQL